MKISKVKVGLILWMLLVLLSIPGIALAEDPVTDTGDTTFIIISAAMVMLMTPGLALFYGGMVRKKNVLSTIMMSFITICIVSVQWVLFGYSLAFGPDINSLVGNLSWLGLSGVGQGPSDAYATTIPHYVFMAFQLMFAIITAAIISGSIAERMRFPAFILFIVLWTTFVYDPLAHWVWGWDANGATGWLGKLGALDFAGGTVVHISSGVSGLVAALVLGRRKGYGTEPMAPHQLPFTVIGAALLWFGWFGFNAGSAVAANGLAASAFVVTNTAAAAAALSWVFAEWLHHGKPTMLGAASGCIAGLVGITPAAGFVTPLSAIVIGLVAGIVCYLAVSVIKKRFGYDDSLDAFGVHGIGGMWGAIATGIFCTKTVNSAGADGLLYGNPGQVVNQLIGVGATVAFAATLTFVILKVVGAVCKLRATEEEEEVGLDLTIHGEDAYPDIVGGSILGGKYSTTPDLAMYSTTLKTN
ncbi:ammonium transporter [Desulfocucumis palustris]|uniref:Ammonium transporter n=1 Tax=Desulfocucumis palustris TaxID=1898651 RepID=A0A2L2XA79_9FIRM|nr:ammonium transporter [Desulfocucumis palustris]GBF33068.1 ammonium transporter [Desulfocucumis palustris]